MLHTSTASEGSSLREDDPRIDRLGSRLLSVPTRGSAATVSGLKGDSSTGRGIGARSGSSFLGAFVESTFIEI